MNSKTLLTLKAMPGLVMVTYCNAQTMLRSSQRLETWIPNFEERLRPVAIGVAKHRHYPVCFSLKAQDYMSFERDRYHQ